jgi:hypothetical protein
MKRLSEVMTSLAAQQRPDPDHSHKVSAIRGTLAKSFVVLNFHE